MIAVLTLLLLLCVKKVCQRLFINTFARYYDALLAGHTGLIREADILPVDTVPDMELFPARLEESR